MRKVILASGVLVSMSGCFGGGGIQPSDRGYISLQGDAEGVRAFMDGQNALITNGKASPDKETDAWSHRKLQEKELTVRDTAPGTLEKLFGGGK
jgi:hypothetical protein